MNFQRRFCLIALFYFSIFNSNGQAPTFNWACALGDTMWGGGIDIGSDSIGNTYTTGCFRGTADFDPGPGVYSVTSAGNLDIFICKHNPIGALVWVIQVGDTGADQSVEISVMPSGELFVFGYAIGQIDMDPGAGVTYLGTPGLPFYFIANYNSSGGLIRVIEPPAPVSHFTTDDERNLYVTGSCYTIVDLDPGPGTFNSSGSGSFYIAKYDTAFWLDWAHIYLNDNTYPQFRRIGLDESKNVYYIGDIAHPGIGYDFDPGPDTVALTTMTPESAFVLKYNENGSFVWVRGISSTFIINTWDHAISKNGNIYLSGLFDGDIDLDPGPGVLPAPSPGVGSPFIVSLDSAGNLRWGKTFAVSAPVVINGLDLDIYENIYITGWFSGVNNFDPAGLALNVNSAGLQDIFINKLDSSGNYIEVYTMGGLQGETGVNLDLNQNGSISLTGSFNGTCDFDPSPITSYFMTPQGTNAAYIVKLDQPFFVHTSGAQNKFGVTSFPNPLIEFTQFHFPDNFAYDHFTFDLVSMNGTLLRSFNGNAESDFILYKEDLEAGIYLYRISLSDNYETWDKLVILDK